MSEMDLFNHDESGDDESPFDSIRQVRPDGTEFWSGRDLQPFMGYVAWQDFQTAIERAKLAAKNGGMDVADLFRRTPKKTGGRPQEDYELARFAAYLVALNGDPSKPESAAGQAYFVVRTREAEVAPKTPVLDTSTPAGILAMAEQWTATARQLVLESEARQQLAAKVEHDAPMLAKAQAHSVSTTAIHRQDFAREVQSWGRKTHNIWIKQEHVMAFLACKGVTISGDRSDAGQATATAIRKGWAENKKTVDKKTGHTSFTAYLNPKVQDLAWKWITKYVAEHGSLELPREIGPAA
ncbi:phage antirepressor KilAC domain-containing protein [Rhodococcus erythropolis]|uniref:phage antirepressor KilAC domain-containing protein n=1 Tax=Rhodococcus erythropolis TaxID=1833 RepID=UPI00294A4BBA|nr:phage antirepressor KilAC domain-containing protein [Rhodococcus erythropolis]MDV6275406.1 phage antirepressor KilAC domain-containing protein [Rhodococcus erythropolis]